MSKVRSKRVASLSSAPWMFSSLTETEVDFETALIISDPLKPPPSEASDWTAAVIRVEIRCAQTDTRRVESTGRSMCVCVSVCACRNSVCFHSRLHECNPVKR